MYWTLPNRLISVKLVISLLLKKLLVLLLHIFHQGVLVWFVLKTGIEHKVARVIRHVLQAGGSGLIDLMLIKRNSLHWVCSSIVIRSSSILFVSRVPVSVVVFTSLSTYSVLHQLITLSFIIKIDLSILLQWIILIVIQSLLWRQVYFIGLRSLILKNTMELISSVLSRLTCPFVLMIWVVLLHSAGPIWRCTLSNLRIGFINIWLIQALGLLWILSCVMTTVHISIFLWCHPQWTGFTLYFDGLGFVLELGFGVFVESV